MKRFPRLYRIEPLLLVANERVPGFRVGSSGLKTDAAGCGCSRSDPRRKSPDENSASLQTSTGVELGLANYVTGSLGS